MDQLRRRYAETIERRRAFRFGGYPTYADAGLDGPFVSPIQIVSNALRGPMLISKDFLDAPTARAHAGTLRRDGILPGMIYTRIIDMALARLGLARADIYITTVFHLLVPQRSHPIPVRAQTASFDAVTRHEILGRRPVALGTDAARQLRRAGIAHVAAPHPSARRGSFEARARAIAQAIGQVLP